MRDQRGGALGLERVDGRPGPNEFREGGAGEGAAQQRDRGGGGRLQGSCRVVAGFSVEEKPHRDGQQGGDEGRWNPGFETLHGLSEVGQGLHRQAGPIDAPARKRHWPGAGTGPTDG